MTNMTETINGCEGFTQTPNCFYDRLLGEINTLSEMKVTLALIRKIYGWHKEDDPDGDLISFSQFVEITHLSRPMVKQGLDAGIKRGSIIQVASGQSFSYRLNLSNPQGEAPSSKRGERLAQLREVKRLNQFRDSTSLDNKPLDGLETKPATGLETKHTKERVLNKHEINSSSMPQPATPVKSKDKEREPGELPRRPIRTEQDRIADYFAGLINSDKDRLTRAEYIAINQLVSEGLTLERCKAGIDSAVLGIRGRKEVVSSFLACVRSIKQLDPVFLETSPAPPTPIQQYQKPAPFEQPKKVFNPDDQRLTPLQEIIRAEKLLQYERDQAEIAAARAKRLELKAQMQLQA